MPKKYQQVRQVRQAMSALKSRQRSSSKKQTGDVSPARSRTISRKSSPWRSKVQAKKSEKFFDKPATSGKRALGIKPLQNLAEVIRIARSIKRVPCDRGKQTKVRGPAKQWYRKSNFHDLYETKDSYASEDEKPLLLRRTLQLSGMKICDEKADARERADHNLNKEAISSARNAIAEAVKSGKRTPGGELFKLLEELHIALYINGEKKDRLQEIPVILETDLNHIIEQRIAVNSNADAEYTQAGLMQCIQRRRKDTQTFWRFMNYFFHRYMELLNADEEEATVSDVEELNEQSKSVDFKVRMINCLPRLFMKDAEFAWVLVWLDFVANESSYSEFKKSVDNILAAGKNRHTRRNIMSKYVDLVGFIAVYNSKEHELKEVTMKMVSVAFAYATRFFKTPYFDDILRQEQIEAREAAQAEFEMEERRRHLERVQAEEVQGKGSYEEEIGELVSLCLFGVKDSPTDNSEQSLKTEGDISKCISEPAVAAVTSKVINFRSLQFEPGYSTKTRGNDKDIEATAEPPCPIEEKSDETGTVDECVPKSSTPTSHLSDEKEKISPVIMITPEKDPEEITDKYSSLSRLSECINEQGSLIEMEAHDDSTVDEMIGDAQSLVNIMSTSQYARSDLMSDSESAARKESIAVPSASRREGRLLSISQLDSESELAQSEPSDHDLLTRPRHINADFVSNMIFRYKALVDKMHADDIPVVFKPLVAPFSNYDDATPNFEQDTAALHEKWLEEFGVTHDPRYSGSSMCLNETGLSPSAIERQLILKYKT